MAASIYSTLPFILAFFVFTSCSTYVLFSLHSVQPESYMDEVFHIPQVQKYCNGNFTSWDPMITTLPGLYLYSVGLLKPLSWLGNVSIADWCGSLALRSINMLFAAGNFYLLHVLSQKLHNQEQELKILLTSTTLSVFPVLYFFTFLYYTDAGATFFVLLMYAFSLNGSHFMAAIIGLVAIGFRQTNIVWVIFVAGLQTGTTLSNWLRAEHKDLDTYHISDLQKLKLFLRQVIAFLWTNPTGIIKLLISIIKNTFWYLIVGALFATFVYFNNGIVVGDRSHHQATLNFPQIFYFLSVCLFFASVHMLCVWKIIDWFVYIVKHPLISLAFVGISCYIISNFTYVHEYLLADNRHYAFYVWSKIYRRHEYVKFALVPIYFYAAWSFLINLRNKDIFWKIVYIICIIMSCVPQKLMEFRYFIIPYLIFRLNMPVSCRSRALLELLLYASVNVVTLYLFMYKPFYWPSENEPQRFMW